jgi:hypothetical protein
MLHYVVWKKMTIVSEVLTTFIVRAREAVIATFKVLPWHLLMVKVVSTS